MSIHTEINGPEKKYLEDLCNTRWGKMKQPCKGCKYRYPLSSRKKKSTKNLKSILPRKQIRSPNGLLIFVLTKLCSFERRYHEQICNKIH